MPRSSGQPEARRVRGLSLRHKARIEIHKRRADTGSIQFQARLSYKEGKLRQMPPPDRNRAETDTRRYTDDQRRAWSAPHFRVLELSRSGQRVCLHQMSPRFPSVFLLGSELGNTRLFSANRGWIRAPRGSEVRTIAFCVTTLLQVNSLSLGDPYAEGTKEPSRCHKRG